MKTTENVKLVWKLKDGIDYKTLESFGFQLRTKFYMRKLSNDGPLSINFVYIGSDNAVLPRLVTMFYDRDDVTPHIQDLIEAGL